MSNLQLNPRQNQQSSRPARCLVFGLWIASSQLAIAHVLSQALNCSPYTRIAGNRIETLPILVFRGELNRLPLQSIRDTNATAFAFPGRTIRSNGEQDAAIRQAVRAGLHIVLPSDMSSLYQAVTGKDMLFTESDISQNATFTEPSMDVTPDQQTSAAQRPLFIIRQPHRKSGAIVFDSSAESATTQGKLEDEGDGRVKTIWPKEHLDIESMLETDHVRCAYNQLNCDFVAVGEVFRKLCQRLRKEYYIREQVDLFKFASRINPYTGFDDILEKSARRANARSVTNSNFVASNRLRVETAYKHLVSRSAIAEAPIKEVMYVLYSISDSILQDALAGKVDLARELSAMGARTPYSDVLYSIPMAEHVRWLSWGLLMLGLACIGQSARVAATLAYHAFCRPTMFRHVGQAARPMPNYARVRRTSEQMQAGFGGKRNAFVEYLMLRAQHVSKAT
jgi:hypothetical protein